MCTVWLLTYYVAVCRCPLLLAARAGVFPVLAGASRSGILRDRQVFGGRRGCSAHTLNLVSRQCGKLPAKSRARSGKLLVVVKLYFLSCYLQKKCVREVTRTIIACREFVLWLIRLFPAIAGDVSSPRDVSFKFVTTHMLQ